MYGHDIRLLVDTGSSHSILHSQIWNEFPEEVRENLGSMEVSGCGQYGAQ